MGGRAHNCGAKLENLIHFDKTSEEGYDRMMITKDNGKLYHGFVSPLK
jgi:hypothetical protein